MSRPSRLKISKLGVTERRKRLIQFMSTNAICEASLGTMSLSEIASPTWGKRTTIGYPCASNRGANSFHCVSREQYGQVLEAYLTAQPCIGEMRLGSVPVGEKPLNSGTRSLDTDLTSTVDT